MRILNEETKPEDKQSQDISEDTQPSEFHNEELTDEELDQLSGGCMSVYTDTKTGHF